MKLRRRCISALLVLCMALTLLPAGAAALEEWWEMKRLRHFDTSNQTVLFEDGDSYLLLGEADADLSRHEENWFLCKIAEDGNGGAYVAEMLLVEPSAEIMILADDIELNGDSARQAGSGSAFE